MSDDWKDCSRPQLCGDPMEPDVPALAYVKCDRVLHTKNGKHTGKHRCRLRSGGRIQWWGPMPVGRVAEGDPFSEAHRDDR